MVQKQPSSGSHWRDSARPSRLFIFNSSATFPLLIFLFHIRLWTLIATVLVMLFFTFLDRYGFSITVFIRFLRSFLAGKRKLAIPWWM